MKSVIKGDLKRHLLKTERLKQFIKGEIGRTFSKVSSNREINIILKFIRNPRGFFARLIAINFQLKNNA